MRRYTWPRYWLLDHTNFDGQLASTSAASTSRICGFHLSPCRRTCRASACTRIGAGALWTAVRASSSIPVLLPPVYTENGEMLVDGCLLDNVPVRVMQELKSGPNVVVSFDVPPRRGRRPQDRRRQGRRDDRLPAHRARALPGDRDRRGDRAGLRLASAATPVRRAPAVADRRVLRRLRPRLQGGAGAADGGRIPVAQTSSTIPPDLINTVMRRPYRERFRLIIASSGPASRAGPRT